MFKYHIAIHTHGYAVAANGACGMLLQHSYEGEEVDFDER